MESVYTFSAKRPSIWMLIDLIDDRCGAVYSRGAIVTLGRLGMGLGKVACADYGGRVYC